jgi:Ca2+/H+ antiporter
VCVCVCMLFVNGCVCVCYLWVCVCVCYLWVGGCVCVCVCAVAVHACNCNRTPHDETPTCLLLAAMMSLLLPQQVVCSKHEANSCLLINSCREKGHFTSLIIANNRIYAGAHAACVFMWLYMWHTNAHAQHAQQPHIVRCMAPPRGGAPYTCLQAWMTD